MVWSVAPVLGAKSVADSVEYYCQKLGFQNPNGIFKPGGHEDQGVYAMLTRDSIDLHIQIRRRELYLTQRGRIESDVYFYVDNVDALLEEFETKGATIVRGITDGPNYDSETS